MPENETPSDFIRDIVAEDLQSGRVDQVVTRFPPEPNGVLHIGHAKSVNLNYGIANEFGGRLHLRFDDTNPLTEETEYVDAIREDVAWLGAEWGENEYFASDYFQQIYDWAVQLIEKGLAYVDDLSPEEIRAHRGTLTEPGTDSPHRDRPVEENLDMFRRMKEGEFPDGSKTLRAKIDMASPNLNLRDPVMYRVLHASHHRTGDAWCIYPTYDWAHGQSDAVEGITHSICTLEFENHRPLYDWFLEALEIENPPRQYEFARLNLTYTVMSKRKLRRLVEEGRVEGWDDPRMPTIAGLRRRGYTPEAIRDFCHRIGVAKYESRVEIELLEHCLRQDLNKRAPRRMGVLNPLKVTITNWPEGRTEELEAINNPEDESYGTRRVPFSGTLYIERDDFMEEPVKKFYRLAPGREVRLRYAYFITCDEVVKDGEGNVVELRCTYDPETRGGDAPDGRRPKATLHWVSAEHALEAEVRVYNRLFTKEDPENTDEEGEDFIANLNPDSLEVRSPCMVEPSLEGSEAGYRFQFERKGYFCVDPDTTAEGLVLNQTVGLRDTWKNIQKRKAQQKGT